MRVGLVTNPVSRHNRKNGLSGAMAEFPDLPQAQPRTTAELAESLAEFRRREVRVIAVNGGDGTLREVLTALPGAYGDEPPDLALMPAGKTNLAARVVGGIGNGAAGLRALLDAARDRRLARAECPVLDIAWREPQGAERRMRGFLFGAAGFTEGTRLASRRINRAGINDNAAVALSIAGTLASTLFGPRRRALLAGEPMSVAVDGAPSRDGARFLTLATTLDRLVLNLTPFWGEGRAPIRWLDIPAPPARLMAALLPTLRGRPRPWMIEAGYASGRAEALSIGLSHGFVVDGEVFEAGPGGVRLAASRPVGFVTPAGRR